MRLCLSGWLLVGSVSRLAGVCGLWFCVVCGGCLCGGCACPGSADVLGGLVRWWCVGWCGGWGGCFCGGVGGGSCGGGFGPRNVGVAGAGPLLLALGAGLVGVWVFRWCPTLPLPGGGSTIGAGGLSFRVRYGSGRFPAPLWPPGRWWGCGARVGSGFPPWWGGGWVGSGLRSGRGWFAWCACRLIVCPPFLFAGSPHVGVAPCSWGLSPRVCGGVVWGVFVLAD